MKGNLCSTKMLPKEGLRLQLIPEHKIECLSPSQIEFLFDCMKENEIIDPVKLDLYEYQAIEPSVHPFTLIREENDPIMRVSPYEALIIQDTSKIGAMESFPDPKPQQEILTEVQIPKNSKTGCVLINPGEEVNVQDMDN